MKINAASHKKTTVRDLILGLYRSWDILSQHISICHTSRSLVLDILASAIIPASAFNYSILFHLNFLLQHHFIFLAKLIKYITNHGLRLP